MILHFFQAGLLGIWAGYHIFSGFRGYFYYKTANWQRFYFLMNAVWGIINLMAAIFVGLHTFFFSPDRFQPEHPAYMQKINICLDAGYWLMGIIVWFLQKTMKRYPQLWQGFGLAILLQGGFLLVLDVVFLFLYKSVLGSVITGSFYFIIFSLKNR